MSALWATMEDATLSPRAHMALLDGPGNINLYQTKSGAKNGPAIKFVPTSYFLICIPKNEIPALSSRSGSLGFSEAWPQPAQTACRYQLKKPKYYILLITVLLKK